MLLDVGLYHTRNRCNVADLDWIAVKDGHPATD